MGLIHMVGNIYLQHLEKSYEFFFQMINMGPTPTVIHL
jgi:hypothetical protein